MGKDWDKLGGGGTKRMKERYLSDMANWWPRLVASGALREIPHPETRMIILGAEYWEMLRVLNGEDSDVFDGLCSSLTTCARSISKEGPWFLRTGQGSGKHTWKTCCDLQDLANIRSHVLSLVEWSETVDMMGLPYFSWAVRERLPVAPMFTAFGGTPITREVRLFIDSDAGGIVSWQPYWPKEAIDGHIDGEQTGWEALLEAASSLEGEDRSVVGGYASKVLGVFEGQWSVDFLSLTDGRWALIDMAIAETSYVSPDNRAW